MISRIARLRAKKGFTIVELVVVIAMISILIAMIVPMLTYDQKPALARALSREAYLRAASVMSDCKAANMDLPMDPAATYTCFYADIDETAMPLTMGLFYIDAGGARADDPEVTYALKLDENGKVVYDEDGYPVVVVNTYQQGLVYKVNSMFQNYLTEEPMNNMAGEIVIVVDKSYRVTAAYWMSTTNDKFKDTESFVQDYILNGGDYCSSYPTNLCLQGQRLYDFSRVPGSMTYEEPET